MNVDAPAVAKKSLHRGGAEDQQRIAEQRALGAMVKSGIDAALDQPRQGDAGEIGADQRKNAENEETAMTINEKLNTMVIAKNLCVLFRCGFYRTIRPNQKVTKLRN